MISVIMLTYNREDLAGRAIESILNQTYRDFEFIIVDNGSTDRSGQIAEEYAARDARLRVIHRVRGNIGSGRNAGLDAARGEYITLIDDDDFVEPNYLEYLHKLADDFHADISVCGSWREVNGVRQPKYVFDGIFTYSGEDAVVELLKREKFNAGTPTKLIAAKLYNGLRYGTGKNYDDIEMTYKIFSAASTAVISGVPLYICTRHARNNSVGTAQNEAIPVGQVEEYLDAFRERTIWLTERFPDRADFWLYTELSYTLSMYDKADIPALREELGILLRENAAVFRDMGAFHTPRDAELLKKYERSPDLVPAE